MRTAMQEPTATGEMLGGGVSGGDTVSQWRRPAEGRDSVRITRA
ncbi:hypothetical protein [Sphaerisporangium fuscum]|nr:hypothetical protein [Sphaerisporangium fuscum]